MPPSCVPDKNFYFSAMKKLVFFYLVLISFIQWIPIWRTSIWQYEIQRHKRRESAPNATIVMQPDWHVCCAGCWSARFQGSFENFPQPCCVLLIRCFRQVTGSMSKITDPFQFCRRFQSRLTGRFWYAWYTFLSRMVFCLHRSIMVFLRGGAPTLLNLIFL